MLRLVGVAAIVALAFASATAQTQSPPGEVAPAGTAALSPEKQLEIKTAVARYNRALRPGQELPRLPERLTVGATVPSSVELITLPQDAMTETPTTTSYRFVLMRDAIAVVDPESRKVVQIIE
jgi:Protein of unknown function (DUF1236)